MRRRDFIPPCASVLINKMFKLKSFSIEVSNASTSAVRLWYYCRYCQFLLGERSVYPPMWTGTQSGLYCGVDCCQWSQPLSSAAALPCCVTPTMLCFVPWRAGSVWHRATLKTSNKNKTVVWAYDLNERLWSSFLPRELFKSMLRTWISAV